MAEFEDADAQLFRDENNLLALRVGPNTFFDRVENPQGIEAVIEFAAKCEEKEARIIRRDYTAMGIGLIAVSGGTTYAGIEKYVETRNPLYLLASLGSTMFSGVMYGKVRTTKKELIDAYETRADAARNVPRDMTNL